MTSLEWQTLALALAAFATWPKVCTAFGLRRAYQTGSNNDKRLAAGYEDWDAKPASIGRNPERYFTWNLPVHKVRETDREVVYAVGPFGYAGK